VAVDLDPAGARGWAALARAEARWMSDWPRAEMHYRRAIALDPGADRPAAGLGELLAALGRRAEAAKEIERGLAANPRSGTLLLSAGIVYLCGGEHDRARQHLVDAAAQGVPPAVTAPWLVRVHAASGATTDALAAGRIAGDTSWAAAYAHAAAGRRDEAEQVLTAMGQRATRGYVPALEFAYVKAALGHTDEALTFVETSVSEHSPWVELIAVDPALAPLRKEPRFAAAVARLKLGEGR
jgi:tetratricopeptide (TPR) repeat protein